MIRIRRKALIPLATALAAGAVAVGSGATFTSQSASTTSFTTGTLSQTNDHAGAAIFSASGLKPGDSQSGTVTITNSGSLAQLFTLKESGVSNDLGSSLNLRVAADGSSTPLYNGNFSSLPDTALGTGAWKAGDSHTYTFTVMLDSTAGNDLQGKGATATFTWAGTQTS